MHSLVILARKTEDVAQEDIWFKIENEILPLIKKLPYNRGCDYKVVIGKICGDMDSDAIIEVGFNSMDDLERAAKSEQLKEIIEKSGKIFEKDSFRIYAAHQM